MLRYMPLVTALFFVGLSSQVPAEEKEVRKRFIVVVSEGNKPWADTVEQLAGNRLLRAFFNQPAIARKVNVWGLRPADLTDKKLYLDPAAAGQFDLVIFDRCAPAKESALPRCNTWFIFDVPPPYKKASLKPLKNVEIKNATSLHPLMKYVVGLDEINFTEAFRFEKLPPPRRRLLETGPTKDGNKADEETSVLFLLERGPYRDLIQAFSLVNDKNEPCTNWYKKVAFPLFLDNILVELARVPEPSPEQDPKERK